jgi:hypothetical protein
MHLAESIPVVVPRILTGGVTDSIVLILTLIK